MPRGSTALTWWCNLAGAGIGDQRWSPERKHEVLESRTRGTTLIATTLAGLGHPPAVFVSGSAVGYYGNRGDEICTEDTGPGTDFLAERVRPVGGRRPPRRRGGDPGGLDPLRHRARRPGRGAGPDAAPVQARAGRQGGIGPPVPVLDHPRRRGGGDPPDHRRPEPRRPGGPHRAPPGHRRRIRRRRWAGCCIARPCFRPRCWCSSSGTGPSSCSISCSTASASFHRSCSTRGSPLRIPTSRPGCARSCRSRRAA